MNSAFWIFDFCLLSINFIQFVRVLRWSKCQTNYIEWNISVNIFMKWKSSKTKQTTRENQKKKNEVKMAVDIAIQTDAIKCRGNFISICAFSSVFCHWNIKLYSLHVSPFLCLHSIIIIRYNQSHFIHMDVNVYDVYLR